MDQYSRFVLLQPLRQATANHLVEFIENTVFHLFSVPERVLTDNGNQFESKLFGDLLNKFGVEHVKTPKYSPQSNASERANGTILSAVRAYIKQDHREWDKHIHEIASAMRNALHSSTNFSPHYLVFGEHKRTHGSDYQLNRVLNSVGDTQMILHGKENRLSLAQGMVLNNLKKAYNRNQHTYNLRSRKRELHEGQLVYVRNFTQSDSTKDYAAKLAHKFIKARLGKSVGTVAFECLDEKGKKIGIYHLKDIRDS